MDCGSHSFGCGQRFFPPKKEKCDFRKKSSRSFPSIFRDFFLTWKGQSVECFTEIMDLNGDQTQTIFPVSDFNKTYYCSNSKVTIVFGFFIVI